MLWVNLYLIPFLIRLCLVVLFPFSALDKIFDWNGALTQAKSSFLPGAPVLLILGIMVELITPVCIVAGWHDRLAALVLAGFCIITALLYHNFWHYSDFWAKGDSKARAHFWDFLKNFGLVGGLLLITFGATLTPGGQVVSHPLSSTPVYTEYAIAGLPECESKEPPLC
ncbi:MAG: DoxX family protein [Candidatus Nitrosoglobus sp.]|jgi:putative oxidoreductase